MRKRRLLYIVCLLGVFWLNVIYVEYQFFLLLVLLVGGVTVGLMFTSMYVGYSAVGSSSFGGVQGRYLQPILPLLFLILSPNGVKNEMNKTGWHLCFCLGNLTILMLACGQLVLANLMR